MKTKLFTFFLALAASVGTLFAEGGTYGDNLTWDLTDGTLTISGGSFDLDHRDYPWRNLYESTTKIVIANGVTRVGVSAFENFRPEHIVLGASVKRIEHDAFKYAYLNLKTITCYSMRPPAVVWQYISQPSFGYLGYSFEGCANPIIYVPADAYNNYYMHDFWGLFDIRPISASTEETNDVKVAPDETTATITWPQVNGAYTYELVIKDKAGNIICTLIFNAQGQLTSMAFHAPSLNNAPQQAQAAGFSFTVTGLEAGTSYDLTLTAKNASGGTLQTKTLSFTTNGVEGLAEIIANPATNGHKVLNDGQVLIRSNDKIYTVEGQLVK